ncbi:MAG: hypothetical protein A2144_13840 [Chloroflexi bacterium RBG_16_50_9]|nr:MAG: hypothetical protein A2144_13840 [Chloroflexi bacterium RBG_16_50_9]
MTKRGVNELLQGFDLGSDYRCKEAFNPDDIQGCYARLYEEASRQINMSVLVEKTQLDSQRQELLYARDILSRLSEGETTPLITQLENCVKSVDDILAKSSPEWVTELIKGSVKAQASVKDILKGSREVIRSARQLVNKAEAKAEEKLSPDAEKMLQMIPSSTVENLKQLILDMMKSRRDSSEVLDAALGCMAELFRKGKIRITVERHQK